MGDAQQGYLYPDHNKLGNEGCGKLSSECEKYFIEEGCFYECDHNLGKFRKHHDCDGGDNGWEITGMPISAAYCDAWYTACRGDSNKLCIGSASTAGKPEYGYFAQPDCHAKQNTTGCRRIDEVYTSGFHMCETMWGGSFTYETDTTKDSYVMSFDEDTTNPNNAKFPNVSYPDICPGELGAIDFTQAALEGCPADIVKASQSYTTSVTSPLPPSPLSPPPPLPPPPPNRLIAGDDYESSTYRYSIVTALVVSIIIQVRDS